MRTLVPLTSRLLTGLALGAALTAAALATTAGSDVPDDPAEAGANRAPVTDKAAEMSALQSAVQASVQADFARQSGDAAGMAAAAEALGSAGAFATMAMKPVETGGQEDEAAKTATGPATAASLMAEAQALAAGNAELSEALAARAAMASRTYGAVGGPGQNTTRVRGFATHTYDTRFRKNELAEVGLDGDNDSDLDLYVFDQNGNIICASESGGDAEYCSWYPKWTGMFRIAVVNRGRSSNVYWIGTN